MSPQSNQALQIASLCACVVHVPSICSTYQVTDKVRSIPCITRVKSVCVCMCVLGVHAVNLYNLAQGSKYNYNLICEIFNLEKLNFGMKY